jgi:molybdopterin-guanine dinucleotide biosynthesis protein A
MGQDKASMRLGNRTFLEHLLNGLSTVPTWVVGGSENQLATYKESITSSELVQWVEDRRTGRGPVEGIATGLMEALGSLSKNSDRWCLVVPVDMPLVNLVTAEGMIAGNRDTDLVYYEGQPDIAGFPLVVRLRHAKSIRRWVDAGGDRLQDLCRVFMGRGMEASELTTAGIEIARMSSANTEPEFAELLQAFERLRERE